MDGVLIHSMPMHVKAWQSVYSQYGISTTETYLYSEEGRVATKAIAKLFKEQKGLILSDEEVKRIYAEKVTLIKEKFPKPPRMEGMLDFVQLVKKSGCAVSVVTGSGQNALMDTINHYYPHCFDEERMVCAKDVQYGKPHPEPYLMGLEKHGIGAEDAIVVENAPLGTQAGKAAGIFVLGLNSGKLSDQTLYEHGADVVVKTAQALCQWWQEHIIVA